MNGRKLDELIGDVIVTVVVLFFSIITFAGAISVLALATGLAGRYLTHTQG